MSNMTPRQEDLLLSIIQEYIRTAEPVSSKYLQSNDFSEISSATIRNEMNELERLGYLGQLHISSGRVPTDKAYRFLVNKLIEHGKLEPQLSWKKKIEDSIQDGGRDPREINKSVAKTLSDLSDQAVIANVIESDDFYKTGISSLFEFPEFRELDRIFGLTNFFDHFESMFNEIEREFFPKMHSGITVMIGHENPFEPIKGETMIVTKYRLPRGQTGSITLIGPTRMNYGKNISIIKYAAEVLNKNFNDER